ncbi:MAG: CCC motif membrane protein [Leeuwenhoekiella sp.]
MEKQKLPNSTLILIFGILGIVGTCCYGVPGFVFAIITLILANKALKVYKENPDLYDDVSQVKTGRILAIISLILSILAIIFLVAIVAYFGLETLQNPELMQQKMESMQGR